MSSELITRIDEARKSYDRPAGLDDLLLACKAALSQQEAEPVVYQARVHPLWNLDLWSNWEECTKAQFDDYRKAPIVNEWETETRALYLHQPKPAPLPQQKLSDIELEILKAHECEWCVGTGVVETSHDSPVEFADCSWCNGKKYIFPQPVASVPQSDEEWIENNTHYVDNEYGEGADVIYPEDLRTFLAQRDAGRVRVPVDVLDLVIRDFKNLQAFAPIEERIFTNSTIKLLTASKEGV